MFEVPGSDVCDVIIEEACVKTGAPARFVRSEEDTKRTARNPWHIAYT